MTNNLPAETASFVIIGTHTSSGKGEGSICTFSGMRTLVLDRLLGADGNGTLPSCGRANCDNHSVPISRVVA